MLDSKVADIYSCSEGGYAGAITAALFLQARAGAGGAGVQVHPWPAVGLQGSVVWGIGTAAGCWLQCTLTACLAAAPYYFWCRSL